MSHWRIQVLGVERVAATNGSVSDVSDIFWPLIGVLLAAPHKSASRSSLANELWPDMPDDHAARHRLGTAIWRLRSRFGGSERMLQGHNDRIALRPGTHVWIDAIAFERRVHAALTQHDALTSARTRHRLERALALYGGDLLPSRDQESIAIERERLRAMFIDASHALGCFYARQGNWPATRDIAQRLCAVEPLREDAQRLLIESHDRCGNRAVAIRQYRALEQLLASELAVAPMPETQQLFARIAASAPAAAAWTQAPDPANGLRATLIAARDQIAALLAVLDARS